MNVLQVCMAFRYLSQTENVCSHKFGYDAFGNVRTSQGVGADAVGGDFRFQGQWLDQGTGLYNFRARDYDARTGTFLSRDPVDPTEQQPESLNPYQFAYSNSYVYSDPSGMFTIAELSEANHIQNILETYANEQAREFLKQKTGELFGNVALGVINQLLPGSANGDALSDLSNLFPGESGGIFEDFLRDNLCPLLPKILSDRLWLTPAVHADGLVSNPGFNCGKIGGKVQNISNPDFLFEEGSPKPVKNKNPQSYLIGDVKLTVSQAHDTMKENKNQWLAMANHADKYQALPLTAYITFKWTLNKEFSRNLPGYITSTLKDMQERAAKRHVILFVANIFD